MSAAAPATHLPRAVILGAGKTGRGLAAVMLQASGWSFMLVDQDLALVERLRAAGSYPVEALGRAGPALTLKPAGVFAVGDAAWLELAREARVVMTAVFGPNLKLIAVQLAALVERRLAANAGPLDIITCENLTSAAQVLRTAVESHLSPATITRSRALVHFVEGMVLTTSLAPSGGGDPLLVRTQDAFRLPCDGDALSPQLGIQGLEPLSHFNHQLMRKIFTYNGINAVISYLGAERGHQELAGAARDPAIVPLARAAGLEASAALVAEYRFDAAEQARWAQDALAKFEDLAIPDPISRNGADPARKLAREDRLVGPALLALKHGIEPAALASGIAAACRYHDAGKPTLLERHGSYAKVLEATAGLPAGDALVALVERTAAGQASARG